ITFGAGSAVDDLSGAELTGTPADRVISPAASAATDGTEDPPAPRPNDGSLRVDEDTPLTAGISADEFDGLGNRDFPASDSITDGTTVSDTARLLPCHSNVNPADVARTVDRMLIAVRSGQLTFHPSIQRISSLTILTKPLSASSSSEEVRTHRCRSSPLAAGSPMSVRFTTASPTPRRLPTPQRMRSYSTT